MFITARPLRSTVCISTVSSHPIKVSNNPVDVKVKVMGS